MKYYLQKGQQTVFLIPPQKCGQICDLIIPIPYLLVQLLKLHNVCIALI